MVADRREASRYMRPTEAASHRTTGRRQRLRVFDLTTAARRSTRQRPAPVIIPPRGRDQRDAERSRSSAIFRANDESGDLIQDIAAAPTLEPFFPFISTRSRPSVTLGGVRSS